MLDELWLGHLRCVLLLLILDVVMQVLRSELDLLLFKVVITDVVTVVLSAQRQLLICLSANKVFLLLFLFLLLFDQQLLHRLQFLLQCLFLHHWRLLRGLADGVGVEAIALDLLNGEDDVLVNFLVHGELASLSEGTIASLKITLERFLLSVNVGVFFEILCQGKGLKAQDTYVLLDGRVRGDVSSKGKACSVGLVAACDFAFVGSLHRNCVDLHRFLTLIKYFIRHSQTWIVFKSMGHFLSDKRLSAQIILVFLPDYQTPYILHGVLGFWGFGEMISHRLRNIKRFGLFWASMMPVFILY